MAALFLVLTPLTPVVEYVTGWQSVAQADAGLPSWWHGSNCDADHWNAGAASRGWSGAGAHALGASYLGIPVCGPRPLDLKHGGDGAPDVAWAKTGWTEYEWECTELAFRFMAQIYGVSAYEANGQDVVSRYSTSAGGGLETVANGTAGKPPLPGDIISFRSSDNIFGHVAVVASSSVDGSGNGSVKMLSQNDTLDGWRTLSVSNWKVSGFSHETPYGWLHDPAGRGVPTLPLQPANPQHGTITDTSAVLTWTDASDNEESFVAHYRIGTGSWTPGGSVGANSTSMTVRGLTPGTKYTFQVGARNIKGTHWSAYVYGHTASLPAKPTDVRVTSTTATTATLVWTDSSSNEASFMSQYRIGDGPWTAGPAVGVNSTTMTITGLQPGRSYTFQIGARNIAGTHWSAYAYGITKQVLPAQPTSPHVTSTTGSSASLAWTDASTNESGFVTQYRIGSGDWMAGPGVPANITSVNVPSLKPGTTYTFQVGAHNLAGTHWSEYAYGSTLSVGQGAVLPPVWTSAYSSALGYPVNTVHTWGPGCIQDFRGGTLGNAALMQRGCAGTVYQVTGAHWARVANIGSSTIGYPTINSHRYGSSWTQDFDGGSWGWNLLMIPDVNNTQAFVVRTGMREQYIRDGGANGKWGVPTSDEYGVAGGAQQNFTGGVMTWQAPVHAPGQPGQPVAGTPDSTHISVSWPGVAGATSYELQWTHKRNPGNSDWTYWGSTAGTSVTIGVTTGQSFMFQVRAVNSGGSSSWSQWSNWVFTTVAVTVSQYATGGDSGHTCPYNSCQSGPTYPANHTIWIRCYVLGQNIQMPSQWGGYWTTVWDLASDGLYYSDAWLHTGSNNPVVPACDAGDVI